MNPASAKPANMASELGGKLNDKIGGKAGSWLAKGQQAMKTLERKKVDGFVVPPAVRLQYKQRALPDTTGPSQSVQHGRLCRIPR